MSTNMHNPVSCQPPHKLFSMTDLNISFHLFVCTQSSSFPRSLPIKLVFSHIDYTPSHHSLLDFSIPSVLTSLYKPPKFHVMYYPKLSTSITEHFNLQIRADVAFTSLLSKNESRLFKSPVYLCVCPLLITFNRLVDFHEIWYRGNAIEGDLNGIRASIILKLLRFKVVRWALLNCEFGLFYVPWREFGLAQAV
jgi:hypothetical protein